MRRVRSWWPGLALVVACVVGLAWKGIGGAVVGVMLALLVVGPAYLIQNGIRRRRGHAASGRGLHRDADEVMDRFASGYLRVLRRRRGAQLAALMVTAGMLTALWVVAGAAWVLATGIGYVLMGAITFALARRDQRHSAS